MLALINDTGMLVVALAVVLLFGASRLPKLARNLGEAGREFHKAHDEANPATDPAPATPTAGVLQSRENANEGTVTLTRAQLDTLLAAKGAGEQNPGLSQPVA